MTYLDYIKVRYSVGRLLKGCQCDEISSCGSGNPSIRLENILVNLAKYLNCKKILQISKYIVAYCKRTLSNKYKLIVVLVDRLSVRWNRLLWSRQPFAPRHPGRDHPPVPPALTPLVPPSSPPAEVSSALQETAPLLPITEAVQCRPSQCRNQLPGNFPAGGR